MRTIRRRIEALEKRLGVSDCRCRDLVFVRLDGCAVDHDRLAGGAPVCPVHRVRRPIVPMFLLDNEL